MEVLTGCSAVDGGLDSGMMERGQVSSLTGGSLVPLFDVAALSMGASA